MVSDRRLTRSGEVLIDGPKGLRRFITRSGLEGRFSEELMRGNVAERELLLTTMLCIQRQEYEASDKRWKKQEASCHNGNLADHEGDYAENRCQASHSEKQSALEH